MIETDNINLLCEIVKESRAINDQNKKMISVMEDCVDFLRFIAIAGSNTEKQVSIVAQRYDDVLRRRASIK